MGRKDRWVSNRPRLAAALPPKTTDSRVRNPKGCNASEVQHEIGQAADRPHHCQDHRLPREQAHGIQPLISVRSPPDDEPAQHRNEINDTATRDRGGPEHDDDRCAAVGLLNPKYARAWSVNWPCSGTTDRGGIRDSPDQVTARESGRIADRHVAAGHALRSSGVGHGTKVARPQETELLQVSQTAGYATDLTSVYWSKPATPFCLPTPLSL